MAKPEPASELELLQKELRARHLRATTARVAILQALRKAAGPVSHGDMHQTLGGRGWDRTTMYRNLIDLARAGFATRADLGDHTWRFEAVRANDPGDIHPHFVCGECGTVECLEGVTLRVERNGGMPRALRDRRVEIQVRGTCDRCV